VLTASLSEIDVLAFIIIPLCLSIAFVIGVWFAWRRSGSPNVARATLFAGIGTGAWLTITWQLAASGVLQRWNATPPPFALLVLTIVLVGLRVALGPIGRRFAQTLPLWLLIAVQGFRLPLEMAMHGLYERGIMPVQMSYNGRNYDILTGATALVVAVMVYRGALGVRWVKLWNAIGLILLINVVTVAILSTPRVAYFGAARLSTFVTYVPFVWLPAVMVLAALVGHLMIFRALGNGVGSHFSRTLPTERNGSVLEK